jgi:hypothetical protein
LYKKSLEAGNFNKLSDSFRRLDQGDELKKADLNVLDQVTGKEAVKGKMGKARLGNQMGNIEGHRLFDVSQDFYNRWSIGGNRGTDGWQSLRNYTEKAAHRFAGVEAFGKNGEVLNQKIRQAQQEMVSNYNETLSTADIKRLYDMVDAYDNAYSRIEDPTWRKVATVSKTAINVTTLPLVVLGSLTEGFNIAAKTDVSTMVRASVNVLANAGKEIGRRAALMGPSERHLTNATQMSQAGQTIRQSEASVLARLTDPNMSDRAQKINNAFFKLNGLTYWTQYIRNVGAEAARLTIDEDINTIRNFPNTGAADRASQRLLEMGLTYDEAKKLAPNSGAPQQEKNALYGRAIDKFNRNVALSPSFSDRPLWMSNQKMWMLSQLQGYPTMFTNAVLPMLLGKFKGGVPTNVLDGLFIVGGMSLIGGLQITTRDVVAGREPDREGLELVGESLNRYMAPKPINMMVNAINSSNYGRSPVETAAGPVLSIGGDVLTLHKELMFGDTTVEKYVEDVFFVLGPQRAIKSYFQE